MNIIDIVNYCKNYCIDTDDVYLVIHKNDPNISIKFIIGGIEIKNISNGFYKKYIDQGTNPFGNISVDLFDDIKTQYRINKINKLKKCTII